MPKLFSIAKRGYPFVRKRLIVSFLVAVFAAIGSGATAIAAAPPAPKAPPKPAPAPMFGAIPDAVTHHKIAIGGKIYPYTARAGTILLRNTKGQPTCRMYYTAFTLDGTDASKRPVTFFYNGGPGSSTVWLAMGSFAPKRVLVGNGVPTPNAPYTLVNNQYTLLDRTDMVFIDAPGTGFSRIVGVGTPKEFYGVDQDVRAFGQFVTNYISKFNRWNSPKFLFGESYGTPRSAMLVNYLQNEGVSMNGVVLQSAILNFSLDWFSNFETVPFGGGDADWDYVFYLPTEAAAAWYHHMIPGPPTTLSVLLPKVEAFAMGEYLNALAQGAQLSPSTFSDVVMKLHDYTGLSEQYIRESNLRVNYVRFTTQLLRNSGQMIGRYDGRYTSYNLDIPSQQPNFDATDASIDLAFISSANYYYRHELGYNPPIPYLPVINVFRQWDWKHDGQEPANTVADLANAMAFNANLHVFSANGYYDFATPFFGTVYELNHMNLPPTLQRNITYGFYQSGHMIYLHLSALAKYHADLENWYAQTLQAGR